MAKNLLILLAAVLIATFSSTVIGAEVQIYPIKPVEEPSTSGQFEISITEQQPVPVTVTYTVSGTALAGVDYVTPSGSIILPAESLTVNLNVSALDDAQIELSETLTVTLTDADVGVDVNQFAAGFATINVISDDLPPPGDRVAFLTSATGTGDMGSWPEAGGATGVDAADAICQTLAEEAGLYKGALFAAWLSTNENDAFCHVNGLGGKVQNNCDRPSKPNLAGPWLRMDGKPMLPDIVTATETRESYYPVIFDETGSEATNPNTFFHGTGALGEGSIFSCRDWAIADSQNSTVVGSSTATSNSWAGNFAGSAFCDTEHRLLCLETGPDDTPLPPREPDANLVFLTSIRGKGQLDLWQPHAGANKGLEAGNAICQSLAKEADLPSPNSFVAWLSDYWVNAKDVITVDGPWARVDGVVIADNLADLTDGTLNAPVNVDETGFYHSSSSGAFTGTLADGTASPYHCEKWQFIGGTHATISIPVDTNSTWTEYAAGACNNPYRLYCFSNQELHVMFEDGFEN